MDPRSELHLAIHNIRTYMVAYRRYERIQEFFANLLNLPRSQISAAVARGRPRSISTIMERNRLRGTPAAAIAVMILPDDKYLAEWVETAHGDVRSSDVRSVVFCTQENGVWTISRIVDPLLEIGTGLKLEFPGAEIVSGARKR
ncbi:MAG TPA: hypothetical protein VF710_00050 [Longimicrobium sp.]|jgi:hypothetical protein